MVKNASLNIQACNKLFSEPVLVSVALMSLSVTGTLLYWMSSCLMMLLWAFSSASSRLSLLWTMLLQTTRVKMMMMLAIILKMPHAVMMVGSRISMFSGPAMLSGSSEIDWKINEVFEVFMVPQTVL